MDLVITHHVTGPPWETLVIALILTQRLPSFKGDGGVDFTREASNG